MMTPISVDKTPDSLERGKDDFHGASGGGPMSLWRKFAIALAVATLLYGGQIRMYTAARNRFLALWERLDALSLVVGILLLAAAFTFVYGLFARTRFRRAADHAFMFIFGGAVISNFVPAGSLQPELFYLTLGVVLTISWMRPEFRLPYRSSQLALIFSPLALILGGQLLAYPEWKTPREAPAQRFPAKAANPVFVFIFDEWSYTRSTEAGAFLPIFKNLGNLAGQSFVFHEAMSANTSTVISVPRFIFQTMDDFDIGSAETFWRQGEKSTPTSGAPSLFSLARKSGYNSSLLGFYLPQRRILGEQVDYVDTSNLYPKAGDFPGKLLENALLNVDVWSDWWSSQVQNSLDASIGPRSRIKMSEHWKSLLDHLRGEARALLKRAPLNSFAVIHLPLPHAPFIFDADGSYLGPFPGEPMEGDPQAYERHLAFLDLVMGEMIETLKASGNFEESMLIVTSDHAWRIDPGLRNPPEGVWHVPLVIKLPGQHEAVQISEEVHLTDLQPAIEAVMSGRVGEADAILRRLALGNR